MPPRRTTPQDEPPAVDWERTPEEERLSKVLAALQGEGKVKVSRRDEKGNLRYVGTLPLTDDFSEETVREAFGGGRYSLRFFLSADNDSYATHMPMEIEGPARERPLVPATPAAAAPVFTGAPDTLQLQLQIAELKGLVNGLTAAMKDGGGGGAGSLTALKDVAEIVRSLMPTAPAPGNADVFTVAREALAFGKEVSKGHGGGSGEFPWETLVDKGVVPLVDLARAQASAKPNPPAASAAPGKGAPPNMAGLPAWARYIVLEQAFILQMAQDGVNPATVADLLLTRWEHKMLDAEWEAFAAAVQEPGFADQAVAMAVQYLPGAAAVRPWLGTFLLQLVEQMKDEEPPGDQGGGDSVTS